MVRLVDHHADSKALRARIGYQVINRWHYFGASARFAADLVRNCYASPSGHEHIPGFEVCRFSICHRVLRSKRVEFGANSAYSLVKQTRKRRDPEPEDLWKATDVV